jgi:hypothetical protein
VEGPPIEVQGLRAASGDIRAAGHLMDLVLRPDQDATELTFLVEV